MKYAIWFILIVAYISIANSINLYRQISNMNIEDIRFGYTQANLYKTIGPTFMGYFVLMGTLFYAISIYLFNYSFKYFPDKKLIIILLLIGSTSIIFSNITIAGRDGIVKWVLLLIGNFLLFRKHLNGKSYSQYLVVISIFIALAFALFLYTTIGRFGSKPNEIILNIFDYYGQGFINFSKIFDLFPNGNFYGRMTFPAFFSANEAVGIGKLNDTITTTTFNLNVFTTIIGSFYQDFGYWGTLLVLLLLYFLFRFIAFIRINSMIYVVLTLYLYQAIISGVFYFMDYSKPFQKFIGMLIILIIFRRYFYYSLNKKIKKRTI